MQFKHKYRGYFLLNDGGTYMLNIQKHVVQCMLHIADHQFNTKSPFWHALFWNILTDWLLREAFWLSTSIKSVESMYLIKILCSLTKYAKILYKSY